MVAEGQEKTTLPQQEWAGKMTQLYRGISIWLWSIPLYLIFAVQTVYTDHWSVLFMGHWDVIGILPTSIVALCALYGAYLVRGAVQEERELRKNLGELTICLMAVAGLSPFFYWFSQEPRYVYFAAMAFTLNCAVLYTLVSLSRLICKLVVFLGAVEQRSEATLLMLFNCLTLFLLLGALTLHRLFLYGVVEYGNALYLIFYFNPFLQWIYVLGILFPTSVCIWWIWNVKTLCFQKLLQGQMSATSKEPAPGELVDPSSQADGDTTPEN